MLEVIENADIETPSGDSIARDNQLALGCLRVFSWRASMKKPKKHPPAFPLYANDFSSSATVEAMSTTAVGAYMLLLCKAWNQEPVGSIPDNEDTLSKWSRVSRREWLKVRESVLAAFVLIEGRWHQKRMQAEWQSMVNHAEERAKSGQAGAEKRWRNDSSAMAEPSETDSEGITEPMASDGSSSSSSISSSSSEEEPKTTAPLPENASPTVLEFPVCGAPYVWHLLESKVAEYEETYPGVDVRMECRKALQWVRDNPTKKKTAGGMTKFLNSWIANEQNKAGRNGVSSAPAARKSPGDPRGNMATAASWAERKKAEIREGGENVE